jgi:exodeoxyribonuclease V gamma subunit
VAAEDHLRRLVDLLERGMREPLPLYCKTSAAWAEAAAAGDDPHRAAAGSWDSGHNGYNEDRDNEHVLVLGGELTFDAMVERSGAPRDDEAGDGWEASESSRFGRCARRLWDGLLEREEVEHQ